MIFVCVFLMGFWFGVLTAAATNVWAIRKMGEEVGE